MNNNSKNTISVRKLNRKQREGLQRRGEILAAAERLFAEKGFFKTSMAEIAQESEFAVGSLYQFFGSKDEVYVALLEGKFEEFLDRLSQRLEEVKGPVEKIETMISMELEHFEEHRNFFRIFATEWGGADCSVKGPLGERITRHVETYLGLLAGVMQSGIRQGVFKRMDSYEMARLFSGMMRSIIHQWIVSGGEDRLAAKAGLIKEVFFDGVMTGKGRVR
jgi:AcrR family transcriptional regulator